MNTRKMAHVLLGALMGLAFIGMAQADTLTVYGTGKDTSGHFLPGGAVDPNYTITSYPGAFSGSLPVIVVDAGGLPSGTVAAANSLTPDIKGTGDYIYTTTFSLAGLDPSTAALSGTWGGDDYAGGAYLNGVLIPGTTIYPSGCCFFYQNITFSSDFVAGTNTLSFVIDQADNWYDYAHIGDMTVTASPASTTPEPSSLMLLGSGLTGLGMFIRRLAQ